MTNDKKIELLQNKIDKAMLEINCLEKQIEELKNESVFKRNNKGEYYYRIAIIDGMAIVIMCCECKHPVDDNYFVNNNYFLTEKRAQQVAYKINFLLKLERLHDIYCPDYEPNWENTNEVKSSIYFHEPTKKYCINNAYGAQDKTQVYFSAPEIAQKVCDILNEELKNNE